LERKKFEYTAGIVAKSITATFGGFFLKATVINIQTQKHSGEIKFEA
jgi:hypothetical protein